MRKGAAIESSRYLVEIDRHDVPLISPPLEMDITQRSSAKNDKIGTWNTETGFKQDPNFTKEKGKPFYRVGERTIMFFKR